MKIQWSVTITNNLNSFFLPNNALILFILKYENWCKQWMKGKDVFSLTFFIWICLECIYYIWKYGEIIHRIYLNNFFIKDGILYDTTDGCSKQYRCANVMWILFVLEFSYKVIIYRCINAPGNGINKIYVINRSYNTFFYM